jgi:hypothetical protein
MVNRTHTIYAGDVVVEEKMIDYEWDNVRRLRDRALGETDWRAVKDRTMSQAWKDYRQALRDLPQNHETANDAVDNWPEAPE